MRRLFRYVAVVWLSVLGLLFLLVALLYVPPVQRAGVRMASDMLSDSSMTVSVSDLRLRFPLRLDLSGVCVIAGGDTLCALQSLHTEVRLLPLLRGEAVVPRLSLQDVFFAYADTTGFAIGVRLDSVLIAPVNVHLREMSLRAGLLQLGGGSVTLTNGRPVPDVDADTTATAPLAWRFAVDSIALQDIDYLMTGAYRESFLSAAAGAVAALGASVDLSRQQVDVESLFLHRGSLSMLTDTSVVVPPSPEEPVVADGASAPAAPWTVVARRVGIDGTQVVYGVKGHAPRKGFDASFIEISDLALRLDSVYNRGGDVAARLRSLSLTERSGLAVDRGEASFSMDSAAVSLEALRLDTRHSTLTASLLADASALAMNGRAALSATMNMEAGLDDVELFMPALDTLLAALPFRSFTLQLDAEGLLDSLRLTRFRATLPDAADFEAVATVQSLTRADSLAAQAALSAQLYRLSFIPRLMGGAEAGQFALPDSMEMESRVAFRNGRDVQAQLSWEALQGMARLDASYRFADTAYRVETQWRAFPVDAFLPHENFGPLTFSLQADGCGLDPFSPRMRAEAVLYVDSLDYGGYRFRDFGLDAALDSGRVWAHILCVDSAARLDLQLTGLIDSSDYTARLTGEIDWLDLKTARLADDSLTFSSSIDVQAWANNKNEYAVKTRLDMVGLHLLDMDNLFDHIIVTADVLQDSLDARVDFPGAQLAFSSPVGVDSLLADVSALGDSVARALHVKRVDPSAWCAMLPDFQLQGRLVPEQVVEKLLAGSGVVFDSLHISSGNAPDVPFFFEAQAEGVALSSFAADTLTASLHHDGERLRYAVQLGNTPATSALLARAGVSGYVAQNELYAALRQCDQEQVPGLVLDMGARVSDSLLHLTLAPESPTLGVPDWSLNADNFIDYYFDGRLAADVLLRHDIQSFSLRSGANPGADTIYLDIENLRLAPILQTLPGTPPVSALLSTALSTDFSGGYPVVGGTVRLDSMLYDGRWVGNMALALDYRQLSSTLMQAGATLAVDTLDAVELSLRYDSDTLSAEPLDLKVGFPAFPLSVANAFLPDDMARIEGLLRGDVSLSGRIDAPRMAGRLSVEEGRAVIPMVGASFRFSPAVVSMSGSRVQIDTFCISGPNNEPLNITGHVDVADLTRPYVDARVAGHNFEIFNQSKNRTSMLYGKAAADVDASVRGYADALSVRGNLVLLNGTEATYVLRESNSLPGVNNYGDMVTFTSFADTVSEESAPTFRPVSGMDMLVNVDIGNAVSLSVELTPDGNSRIDLQGGGSLTYSMNKLGDSRFTGRYELSGGTVCYTPPLIGQKLFSIKEGSSVVWEGDMADPVLDITAIDKLSVDVASGGTTRTVQFQVSIAITQSLDNLSIVFDVAAPGDMTIQNELTSMTAEQRASQAMSLLIYNTYTGPSASQGDLFTGNPLNQFLQNELNKWSRNNLKNVNLSFGINSRGEADGTTRTDYSYQLSKDLFNDRVRIVVGGSYSPDDNSTQALKENLVDDIALEYKLDRRDNMVLKIFRHTGQETILEGEVTETGLGFAVRKKLSRLADLFRRSSRKQQVSNPSSSQP